MTENAGRLHDLRSELTDISSRLNAMRAKRFEFVADHDADGIVVALMGVRVHHSVIDIFQLYGEDDATATRLRGIERNIRLVRTILWHTRGSATSVIDDLLDLSDTDTVRTGQPPIRNGHRVSHEPSHQPS